MVKEEVFKAAAVGLAALNEMKEDMDKKILELQAQIDNGRQDPRPKGDRPREGLTSRRAFSQLPSYSGKPEEYDDWSFQVRRFLSEETDFKELMFKLKAMSSIPNKEDVAKVFNDMNLAMVDGKTRTERKEKVDQEWMNHQLFQMLCLNLKGKALKSVQLLDNMEMTEVNGVIGWCKLAYDTSAMASQRLQGLAAQFGAATIHPKE
jgi:hypothetical protein